jgi:hypothetical protein
LLCARGIGSFTFLILPAVPTVTVVGNSIGSCYIDPLADDEAKKRRFDPAQLDDELFRKATCHSKEEFQQFLKENGDLAADSIALAIYCVDLRPHSFQISKMEAPVSDQQAVMIKLLALRRDLGKPKCFDSSSCFVLTKRLRDGLSMQKFVLVKNPATGAFE